MPRLSFIALFALSAFIIAAGITLVCERHRQDLVKIAALEALLRSTVHHPPLEQGRSSVATEGRQCVDSAGWTNGKGMSCLRHRDHGYCKKGTVIRSWAVGSAYNFPERNCCGCGKQSSFKGGALQSKAGGEQGKGTALRRFRCTGADSKLKPRTGSAAAWRCGGGLCIKAHGRCDGVPICADKSDEEACPANVYMPCLFCMPR